MKLISIKIFIMIMFISGLLQFEWFDITWENLKTIKMVHTFSSIIVSVFFVIPFVNRHAYKYIVIRKVNSIDGWLLGFLLLFITISGFYLFFVGNRGGDIWGIYSLNIHLYGSFLMIILFFFHIRNQTFGNKPAVMTLLVSLLFFVPTVSYSKVNELLNIKLENNKTNYHIKDWTNSTKCKSCHTEIFNQWADSNHKNLVDSNPYYMVMEGIAGEVEGENFRQWCMGCHNPSGLTTGLKRTSHPMNDNFLANTLMDKGAKTLTDNYKKHGSKRLEEGVSCLTCHRITDAKSTGNASYTLDLTNREKYPFEDSDSDSGEFLSEKFINAKPNVHKKSYSKKLYKSSAYCASCHDETSPLTGKQIVSTFKEWKASSYNNPDNKEEHKTCIDCHMTYLKDNKFSPLRGTSTNGGTIKEDVKVHYFSGSNHFLSGLKSEKHEDQSIQLLKTAAKLDVNIKNNQVIVGVKNVGAGHHLPTGVADFRELWLDITVKDASGKVVFTSGKLKEDGNLDKDARPFMKVFGDKEGKPVGLLFWRYEKLLSDTRIKAGERRVETYDIQNSNNLKYPLTTTVKLNFRIYPQWVTSYVQKAYPALPSPPVVELNIVTKTFSK